MRKSNLIFTRLLAGSDATLRGGARGDSLISE